MRIIAYYFATFTRKNALLRHFYALLDIITRVLRVFTCQRALLGFVMRLLRVITRYRGTPQHYFVLLRYYHATIMQYYASIHTITQLLCNKACYYLTFTLYYALLHNQYVLSRMITHFQATYTHNCYKLARYYYALLHVLMLLLRIITHYYATSAHEYLKSRIITCYHVTICVSLLTCALLRNTAGNNRI